MISTKTSASDRASIRRRLLISGSVLAVLGGIATAQVAVAADAAPAASSNSGTDVEAVTVTARKKEEKLMDVPVAATVLSATTINRYDTTDLISIASIAPGIQVTRTGGGTPGGSVYIRGIGIFGPDYASEQPVALVIDGMPITRGHFVDTGFFDQSNVQILKGPQSLFYGKNSPAGVVSINSNSPTPGAPMQGYIKGSYGISTQDPIIEGAISLPIGDTLAIRLAVRAFQSGGRLFYVGAGTSGRLGVLDASECPPTFRTPPEWVQGIIAGGARALHSAVEGAEDDSAAGAEAVRARGVTRSDVVVGIAASGRTPFVWGALHAARAAGAATGLISFNPGLRFRDGWKPDHCILPDTGPEVITGSTRLKSGTATKLVLNAITSLAMVQLGKVMDNLMVDLNPSNDKLRDRAVRIVMELTGASRDAASRALQGGAREPGRGVTVRQAVIRLRRRGASRRGPAGETGP